MDALGSPWHQSAITDGMTPVGVGGKPGDRVWVQLQADGMYRAVKAGWRRVMTPTQMEVTTAGMGLPALNQAAVQALWDRLEPRDPGELKPGIPRFWREAEIVLSLAPPGEPAQRLYQADWWLRLPKARAAAEPDVAVFLDPYWLWGDGKPAAACPPELLEPLRQRHGGTAGWWAARKKGLMWMPESYWRAERDLTLDHETGEASEAVRLALAAASTVLGRPTVDIATLIRLATEWEGPAHADIIRVVDGFQDTVGPDGVLVSAERAYYRDAKRKLIEQGFGDDAQIKNWRV